MAGLMVFTMEGLASAAPLPYGVAAGDTTATSAVLWARATQRGKLRFTVSDRPNLRGGRVLAVQVDDPAVPARIKVENLKPDTQYHYRAVDKARKQARGRFRTLPVGENGRSLAFGVTGDARAELAPYPALRNVPEARLDFLVCIGDCIYAEDYYASADGSVAAKSLDEYRAKYARTFAETLGLKTLAAARAATAQFAMIDDHEVLNDFAGGAAPATDSRFDRTGAYINETARYQAGLRAFHENMPIAEERYGQTGDPRDAGKRKLYRARTHGKAAMFAMVDARSFRDAELAPVARLADRAAFEAFLARSFDPGRTLLGKTQLADLKKDLKAAQGAGVKWKFVLIPEPIQNLGGFLGLVSVGDRYEGYAAERADLLDYIHTAGIQNVVFVTADIHCTLVNNLTYERAPGGPRIATSAFEISTGPIATESSLGPIVANAALDLRQLTPEQKAVYDALPVANDPDSTPNDKDDFIKNLIDGQLADLGYDAVGLEGSPIRATLLQGDYFAGHSYGWTEFRIDGSTKKLTVTTYGVPAYDWSAVQKTPGAVAGLRPKVVSQFEVTPR